MTDVTTIAERYIELWNERNATRRRELFAANWISNASYVDPIMSGDGHGGMLYPTMMFRLNGVDPATSRPALAPFQSTAPSGESANRSSVSAAKAPRRRDSSGATAACAAPRRALSSSADAPWAGSNETPVSRPT